jgi:hypothetical protein
MSPDMHVDGDGPTVFAHACKMGLEGIEASGVQQRIIGRRRKLAGRLSGIA